MNVLVTAWLRVPSLRNINREIRIEDSAEVRQVTLDPAITEPYQIARDIYTRQPGLHKSTDFQPFFDIDLKKNLYQEMKKVRSIVTRVHAELLLVDRFSRGKFDFVEDDKYVGCSKPACFFCYSWMKLHHKGFVLPAGHNKVVLGCRGPDCDVKRDKYGYGASILSDMHKKMDRALEEKIITILLDEDTSEQVLPRFCSTNGSSRAPSVR